MRALLLGLVCMGLVAAASADLVQSLSNPSAGMAVDGSRADWTGVTPYTDDSTGESGIGAFDVDWERISMAHATDGSVLFVRYQQANAADFNSFPAFYNLYIDVDQDRNTGYFGGGSQFAVGADYLVQGVSVFSFAGAGQTDFSWNFVGGGSFDNSFSSLDLEWSIATSLIGSPESFHFLVYADNALNGNTPDYYPDSANGGSSGGYFQYVIPEPGSLPLALVAAALVGAYRRIRR